MPEALNPYGSPVRVGSATLRTPGLGGTATALAPGAPGTRGAEMTTSDFEAALAAEQVRPLETIEISGASEVPLPNVATRSTSFGEPAIELEVPDPGERWGQVVLAVDEAGVTTWHMAEGEDVAPAGMRGGGTRRYIIRRRVVPPDTAPGTRGLVGAVGKKLLKVLVFPLVDPVIGKVGDFFAGKWEERKRPYRVRTFTPDDYRSPDGAEIATREAWDSLAGGRALLLVHGTFSRARTSFGSLPRDFLETLHRTYGGRVFAFDHYTLSHDPRENVDELVRRIPDGTALELDVLTSSRGALAARVLAEKQSEISLGSRTVRVRAAVFQAGPNAGTPLADPEHMGAFIDSYTNLLNFFPDSGVTDALEAIITVVKQLAVGALRGLSGLQAMRPGGAFLTWLNDGPVTPSRYHALAADYEPSSAGLLALKDAVMDAIFKADNDLVVPTDGVWDANGAGAFPIADRLVLGPADGVAHSTFFIQARVRDQLLAWLTG